MSFREESGGSVGEMELGLATLMENGNLESRTYKFKELMGMRRK